MSPDSIGDTVVFANIWSTAVLISKKYLYVIMWSYFDIAYGSSSCLILGIVLTILGLSSPLYSMHLYVGLCLVSCCCSSLSTPLGFLPPLGSVFIGEKPFKKLYGLQ